LDTPNRDAGAQANKREGREEMRTVKQIAISESVGPEEQSSATLVALCDDGTLWYRLDPWSDKYSWNQMDLSDLNPKEQPHD
jgi:hypothetical protein